MIIFVMLTSTAFMLGYSRAAKAGGWLATLLGGCAASLLYFFVLRLIRLHPDKNWFEILCAIYGKVLGKIIGVLYIIFSFHYTSILGDYLTHFVSDTSNNDEMHPFILIFIVLACILIALASIYNSARFIKQIVPVILIIIVISAILSLYKFDAGDLRPVLEAGGGGLMLGGLSMMIVPFCQILLVFPFFKYVKADKHFAKALFLSLFVSAAVISIFYALNVGVLGKYAASELHYPSYMALSVLNINPFLQRIEVLLSVHYLLGTLIKTAISFIFVCDGLACLFNLKNRNLIVVPAGAFVVAWSTGVFTNTEELFRFFEYYPFIAAPFVIVLPVITYIVAEIKSRSKKIN